MTTVTIPFVHLEVIRQLVAGVLPSVQNSSLFSAAATAALTNASGAKKEKSTKQDAETVAKHCVLIQRNQGILQVSGVGLYGAGVPVSWQVQWEDIGKNTSFAIDPNGLFYLQVADAVFWEEPESGPVTWAVREVRSAEGRTSKTRIRRLSASDLPTCSAARTLPISLEQVQYDLTEDIDFFRTLAHMTSALLGTGFWTCVKWGEGEDARLTSSWLLPDSSFGFMDMPSPSNCIPPESEIVLSQGNMRTLSWILDRFRDLETVSIKVDGDGDYGQASMRSEQGLQVFVDWWREHDAVTAETQEESILRCRRAQSYVEDMETFEWSMLQPISPLSDGLLLASALCPPVLGRETQAGVRVSMDIDSERTNYVFRARNTEESAAFRVGTAEGDCVDLPRQLTLTPAQAKSAQIMLRTVSSNLGVRNAEVYLQSSSEEKNPGMLLIRGSNGLLAGGVFSTPYWADRILTDHPVVEIHKATPYVYVDVRRFIDVGKFVFQAGSLSAVARGKSGIPVLCTLDVQNFLLRLETGSDNHIAGGLLPAARRVFSAGNGARMHVRIRPLFLQSALMIFEKILLQTKTLNGDKLSSQKVFVRVAMGGGDGLFLALHYDKIVLARLRTAVVEEPCWKGGPETGPDPSYTRFSPYERTNVVWDAGEPLPPANTLRKLEKLHQTFGLENQSEGTSPAKLSLTGMEYEPSESSSTFRAADTHRAVRCVEEGVLFGNRRQILPSGFFSAAALLKEKRDTASYVEKGSLMRLSTDDLYIIWEKSLPADPETLYPTKQIEVMLQQKMPHKSVDEATGLITGLGSPGRIAVRISKEILLSRLGSLENGSLYGRVAWIWEKDGSGYLMEDDLIGDENAEAELLGADVLVWNTPKDHFFLCIGRRLLESSLAALMETDDVEEPDVDISLSSVGVQLSRGQLTAILMPMVLRDKEQEYLNQMQSKIKTRPILG